MTYANAVNTNGSNSTRYGNEKEVKEKGIATLSVAEKDAGRSAIIYALKNASSPFVNALNECKLNRAVFGSAFSTQELGYFDYTYSDVMSGIKNEFSDLAVALRTKARSGDSISSIASFFEARIKEFKKYCQNAGSQLNILTKDLKDEHQLVSFGKLTKNCENKNKTLTKFGSTFTNKTRGLLFSRKTS